MKKILYIGYILYIVSLISCKDTDPSNDNDPEIMNETDRNFMVKTGYANYAEIDAAQLAIDKSANDSVLLFATIMNNDHQQSYSELRSIESNLRITITEQPDIEYTLIKQQLMNFSGETFDSVYLHVQIMHHQKTISLFEDEAKNGLHPDLKSYAKKYLPALRHHLLMAQNIAAEF